MYNFIDYMFLYELYIFIGFDKNWFTEKLIYSFTVNIRKYSTYIRIILNIKWHQMKRQMKNLIK